MYLEEDGIHTILELMQIYREKKGLIFIKACTLLGILALDSSCKMVSFFFNIYIFKAHGSHWLEKYLNIQDCLLKSL